MNDPFAPIGGQKLNGAGAPARGLKSTPVTPIPKDAPARPIAHPKLGKPTTEWRYVDAGGAPLFFVCRFDHADSKDFRPLALHRAAGGALDWRWESLPAPRPIYALDKLAARPAARVVVCEGEKSADAAALLLPDYVATTSPNGSKSAAKADWSAMRGRDIVIWPDCDAAGLGYAESVAALCFEAGAIAVAICAPPDGAAIGFDAADALAEDWPPARVQEFIAAARLLERPAAAAGEPAPKKKKRERRVSHADALMTLVGDLDLWGSDGEYYATIEMSGRRESWPLRSASFRNWLSYSAYNKLGQSPGPQVVETVVRTLCAKASYEGRVTTPWLRVGQRDGALYIDLADRDWNVVEIKRNGWRVIPNPGVPFVRTDNMRALPFPEEDGAIDSLRGFCNTSDDGQFKLIVGWLVAALYAGESYPILCVNGEAGSGKSELCKFLRSLVDPNKSPLRNAPKDERDLMTAGYNNHCLAFDNFSSVNNDLSDLFCRVATGAGFGVRANYTDRDEVVVNFTRPIAFNGIPDLMNRPDLAQRSLIVRLDHISPTQRRATRKMQAEWEVARPRVLGAICTALSSVLRNLDKVDLSDASPRMIDFAELVTAAEPGLGWEQGSFLEAFNQNQRETDEGVFEAQPVAVAVLQFIREEFPSGWSGAAHELLAAIEFKVTESVRRSGSWPKNAQGLGMALSRCEDMLRKRGLLVDRKRSNGTKWKLQPVDEL